VTKLGNSYSGSPRVTDENTSHYKLAVSECVGDLASSIDKLLLRLPIEKAHSCDTERKSTVVPRPAYK